MSMYTSKSQKRYLLNKINKINIKLYILNANVNLEKQFKIMKKENSLTIVSENIQYLRINCFIIITKQFLINKTI